jgi:hypothetical protein
VGLKHCFSWNLFSMFIFNFLFNAARKFPAIKIATLYLSRFVHMACVHDVCTWFSHCQLLPHIITSTTTLKRLFKCQSFPWLAFDTCSYCKY